MSKKKYPGRKLEPQISDSSIEDDDQVRLKPILGLRPGVYLAIIYGLITLFILFLVLLQPGISNPGSMVTINSEPWGAAVKVDGIYMNAAPCKVFVSKGRHSIELSLPGFLTKNIEKDIGGRLFASLLFPLKTEISEKLETRDPAGAFTSYAAEYAAWTFAGEPSVAYQIPLSLSEGAYRLGPFAANPDIRDTMEDTISAAARFTTTRAGLRDLIRAKSLVDNNGLSPSPLSLLGTAEDIINFLEENPGAALWLGAILTGNAQSDVTGSSWYAEAANLNTKAETAPLSGEYVQAGLLRWRRIPGGPLPSGRNFPPGTELDTFYICESVISAPAWERFLEEQPKWKPENSEDLIKEGLVKEDYLNTGGIPGAPAEGVSGISWYAAKAFCEWLSSSLPSQFASWEVRLPTEAEWEYAARAMDYGHFWEWCEDPYAPLSFLSAPAAAVAGLGSPERSLRGGAWVNPAGSVKSETRASLPPSFCSPFVSARPVIAPKRTHL